jgi:hypothetical protein
MPEITTLDGTPSASAPAKGARQLNAQSVQWWRYLAACLLRRRGHDLLAGRLARRLHTDGTMVCTIDWLIFQQGEQSRTEGNLDA